ncbi:uncharacterized protein LOC116012841 [Ipomoea triloba]|uniref:uncharacterized protein LOC116012841 n=1 Tax=Ipomoea triloba TaxID=35885 RepID=UPI00125E4695|nr:uncharacterized protein LOC116012841 [Ipomoea triloba]
MYYGGEFVLQPALDYQKGIIEYFDYFNGEESSMLELRKLVKELKVNDKTVNFWFKYGTCRDPKFKKIKTDAELYNIVYEIPENKTVEIFVEHVVEDQWDYDVEMTHISDEVRIMNEVYANAIATPLSLGEGPSNFVAASLSDFYSTPNREYFEDNLYSHEVEDNLKDTAINCKATSEFVMVGPEDITENDCVQSEEVLRSLGSESEGEVSKHVATFQEKNLHKEGFKFQEGMIFNSSAEFKWDVKCHQAMRRKDIKFVKNEGRRVSVKCREKNCKWTIYSSKSNENCPFTIKTYRSEHICGDQYENKIINSGFLAKFYKDEFRLNTSWGRMEFQEHVKAKFNCQLSMHQSYRAKKQALKYLEGSEGEQFDLLHDYCEELRRTNPGTKVKLKLDSEFTVHDRSRFLRLYICFGACKEGFLLGCRPLIGLDGCHLKGSKKGGQLLSVVGIDANNNMFPIAFSIVEGELKDSWKWFLQQLDDDLSISENPHSWTIMSDKQKGLLPVVDEVLPNVEHRFCARHMHANFQKDGFSGNTLKQHFWAV